MQSLLTFASFPERKVIERDWSALELNAPHLTSTAIDCRDIYSPW